MLYPRDGRNRADWYAAAMVGAYHEKNQGAPPEAWISALWELRQAPQRVYEDGMARISRADLSGHVLLYFLRLAEHHPRHCKLERAKALVVNFTARQGETISESLIDKLWAEFKTVSHLWASFELMIRRGWNPHSREEFLTFLGLAEFIRTQAEGARLVTPGDNWQLPEMHDMPAVTDPDLPPLAQDQAEFLDRDFPA